MDPIARIIEEVVTLFSKKKKVYQAVILVAGKADNNGNIYTAEALEKMAKKDPERLKYEHDRLYSVMEI